MKRTLSITRLMRRLSHDPSSVTGDEIVEAVETLPKETQKAALVGLLYLRGRREQRARLKLVKGRRH